MQLVSLRPAGFLRLGQGSPLCRRNHSGGTGWKGSFLGDPRPHPGLPGASGLKTRARKEEAVWFGQLPGKVVVDGGDLCPQV